VSVEWYQEAGRIIDAVGTDQFPGILAQGLRAILPYDFTVIFGYVGAERPLAMFDDFTPDRHRLHVTEYLDGPYLIDPFFLASRDPIRPGVWRLSELAPDRFQQGEYYRNYYARTGLAEEIGFLIETNSPLRIVVSLMRCDRRFTAREVGRLRAVWPVIDAACRKNWERMDAQPSTDSMSVEERVEAALQRIGEGHLTPREREVVQLTLRGHSAEATAGILGISSGTVRIHRRNIYAKLRISSQGELFSEFLSGVVDSAPRRGPVKEAAT
jgi:DNA-binding CsgD family transcriptional regulator